MFFCTSGRCFRRTCDCEVSVDVDVSVALVLDISGAVVVILEVCVVKMFLLQ